MNRLPVNLARFTLRVLRDFFLRNNGLLLTSAVAYNALLSLIPLAAVLVVFFSKFFDQTLLIEAITTEVAFIAPAAGPMLEEVLRGVLDSREAAGWIGVGVLLFFSSIAFRVLENAIAIIFHRPVAPVKRKFWISALLPYFFILLVAAGLIVVTVLNVLVDASRSRTWELAGVDFAIRQAAGAAIYLAGVLGLALLFTTLYKVMPATRISFRLALSGGVTAAILWEILRNLLVSYFSGISMVGAVYGSMAATIIILLTLEAAALIVLLGAQVIADVQRSLKAGTPWHEDPGPEP